MTRFRFDFSLICAGGSLACAIGLMIWMLAPHEPTCASGSHGDVMMANGVR